MKIGLVLDRFDAAGGGLERWTAGFASFLSRRGHAPHVLAFETGTNPGAPVHLLAAGAGVLARARSAQAGVAALGASVVLDTGTGWSGDVFMPCTGSRRLSQLALVATHGRGRRLRAAVSPVSIGRDLALAALERRQVRRAKQIVAVSALVRDLLVRQHGVETGRISVIPNGVETARFSAARLGPLRAAARAALGVGDGVLFLGSAHNPWLKGMDRAIEALALLVRERRDVHLAMAGSAVDAAWHGMALAAAGRVHFLGPVADMAPWFAAADALVHPTRWDACSLSTIEAGAAGLAVITTARNGAAALIEEGVTGFVVDDPEDAGALAARMRALLDPAVRRAMGIAARAASAGQDVAANYEAVLSVLERFKA